MISGPPTDVEATESEADTVCLAPTEYRRGAVYKACAICSLAATAAPPPTSCDTSQDVLRWKNVYMLTVLRLWTAARLQQTSNLIELQLNVLFEAYARLVG